MQKHLRELVWLSLKPANNQSLLSLSKPFPQFRETANMGYKHMTDLNQGAISGNDAFNYNIDNLASQSSSTLSGMREDILLASWLIVLLRTREGERVAFDWTYQNSSNVSEEPYRHLSMENVMQGLEDSIQNVTGAISNQLPRAGPSKDNVEPGSILLSTSALSQQSEDLTVRLSSTRCTFSSWLTFWQGNASPESTFHRWEAWHPGSIPQQRCAGQ